MDNSKKNNEPQSYGSQDAWVTGETGQEVNPQKGNLNSQHGDFYASRQKGDQKEGSDTERDGK